MYHFIEAIKLLRLCYKKGGPLVHIKVVLTSQRQVETRFLPLVCIHTCIVFISFARVSVRTKLCLHCSTARAK